MIIQNTGKDIDKLGYSYEHIVDGMWNLIVTWGNNLSFL